RVAIAKAIRIGPEATNTSGKSFAIARSAAATTSLAEMARNRLDVLAPSLRHFVYIPVSATNPGHSTDALTPVRSRWAVARRERVNPTKPCLVVAYVSP